MTFNDTIIQSCCYFPTTTIAVDDDKLYLNSLTVLIPDDMIFRRFDDGESALRYFQHEYMPLVKESDWIATLPKDEVEDEEYPRHEHAYFDVDYFAIHKQIYNPKRFEHIGVVMSDYAMPGINGLELFEAIQYVDAEKFLLTGVATESTGLSAFNRGIINHFVVKQPMTRAFGDALYRAILYLQERYFSKIAKDMMRQLAYKENSIIGAPAFHEIMEDIIAENDIVEYYLISETGSYLMLDSDANPSWLVVKSEPEMQYYSDSAAENEAPSAIVKPLKKRKKLLFLFTQEDDETVPYADWDKYMHPAKKLTTRDGTFYYTYFKGKSVYDLDLDSVLSHNEFCELQREKNRDIPLDADIEEEEEEEEE